MLGHPPGGTPHPPQQLIPNQQQQQQQQQQGLHGAPIPNLGGPNGPPQVVGGAPVGGHVPHHVTKPKKPRGNAIRIIDPNTMKEVQTHDEGKKAETTPVVITDPADQHKEVVIFLKLKC